MKSYSKTRPSLETSYACQKSHGMGVPTNGNGTSGYEQPKKVSEPALPNGDRKAAALCLNQVKAHCGVGRGESKQNIVNNNNTSAPVPVFQTAGKNATIAVPEEDLSRAASIFATNTTSIYDDEHNDAFISSNSSNQMTNATNEFSPSVILGFQTCGSGKIITVSGEQMAKAAKVLDACHQRDTSVDFDSRQPCLKKPSEVCCEEEMGQRKQEPIQIGGSSSSSSFPTFRTAGKESAIKVSEESLNAANKFMIGGNSNNFSTSQSNISTASLNSTLSGFRFSSSGKSITISEEQMDKAAHLLGNANTAPKDLSGKVHPNRLKTTMADSSTLSMFKTAGINSNIAVSDEGLAANSCQEERGTSASFALPMFRTAGKSSPISISEEGLLKANDILSEKSRLHDIDRKCPPSHHTTKQDQPRKQKNQEKRINLPVNMVVGFASAGSGKTIAVSEENLSKASKLLSVSARDESRHEQVDVIAANRSSQSLSSPSVAATSGLGFASAASGKVIAVSDKSIVNATKVFAQCDDHKAKRNALEKSDTSSMYSSAMPPTIAGFTSAGSGKTISVSEENLSKATKLLAAKSVDSKDARVKAFEEDGIFTSLSAGGSIGGFATAGCGKTIDVSEESLSNATNILAGYDDSKAKQDAFEANANNNISEFSIVCPTTTGFASAGSGKTIAVSEENLSKASKLLSVNEQAHVEAFEESGSCKSLSFGSIGFASASSCKTIDVSEENLSNATKLLLSAQNEDSKQKQVFTANISSKYSVPASASGTVGFASAGSGNAIVVTDESISNATKLLSKCNDSRSKEDACEVNKGSNFLSSTVVPISRPVGFSNAGSGAMISVSEENLSKVSQLLLDGKEPEHNVCQHGKMQAAESFTMTMFQTAGKKSNISISEESLNKTAYVFNESEAGALAASSLPQRTIPAKDTSSYDNGETKSDLGREGGSEESFMLGFTKGGSKARIAVTDESMAKADRILQSKDNSCEDNLSDDTNDLLKSRPSVSNQRVRFSLDNTQLKTFQKSSDNEESEVSSSMPMLKGFAFAGSSKSIHVSADSLAKASSILESSKELSSTEKCSSGMHEVARRSQQSLPNMQGLASVSEAFVTPEEKRNLAGAISSSSTDLTMRHSPPREQTGVVMNKSDATPKNVVTDRKDVSASTSALVDRTEQTIDISNSPEQMHTPLHEMTNVAHDSLQSVMKSKRLFQSTTKQRNDVPSHFSTHSNNIDGVGVPDYTSNYSKVTLGQFAVKHNATERSSWESCIDQGVKEVTMRVTSINATKLRFSKDDGVPLFFLGQRDAPKCSHVGKGAEMSEWLINQGCDETLITGKWIQNHCRWIIWKLAAMERRFPTQLGGQYLTYSHVLSQLKGRYEKELRGAKRPAVRKILNKDVSANMPIILCVSQILRFKSKLPKQINEQSSSSQMSTIEEIRLELSDGWYAIAALLDCVLTKLVEKGMIQVGSKILICNAQLVGSDDGVDPLDDSYNSDRRNCPLLLKITANNTRLAVWDAKLGFVHPKYTAGGTLLVKSLSDIFPDGGSIPAIDLVICKRYPRMFREQIKDNTTQNVVSNHLTEAEEAAHQSEHDMNHQRASEKYSDDARKECAEVSSWQYNPCVIVTIL